MRFLLLLVLAVGAVYAALTLSLYGSVDPCDVLRTEIVAESVRLAEQRALEREELRLSARERTDLERRHARLVEARIGAAELSRVECLRLFVTLKSEGRESESVRPLLPETR